MTKPVSLGELASRAGVSPATVSIVLNDRPLARHVADKTKERILRLAAELNYRPNHLARAMLEQSTRTIGYICGDIATPYYAELADELAKAAEERGYRLITQPTRWDVEKEFEALEMLLTRAVDGVLMYSIICESHQARVEKICRTGRPLVFLGSDKGCGFSCVRFDVLPGMMELFSRLEAGGMRDVAIMDDPRFPAKFNACRAAGAQYGIVPRCFEFRYGDAASVEACIERVGRERPELVIVGSDYVSAMTVSRFGQSGIRVPDDISVVTIDGTRWSELYNPPLSAIRQDGRLLARAGMDELFRRLEGAAEPRAVVIPTFYRPGCSIRWKNPPESSGFGSDSVSVSSKP